MQQAAGIRLLCQCARAGWCLRYQPSPQATAATLLHHNQPSDDNIQTPTDQRVAASRNGGDFAPVDTLPITCAHTVQSRPPGPRRETRPRPSHRSDSPSAQGAPVPLQLRQRHHPPPQRPHDHRYDDTFTTPPPSIAQPPPPGPPCPCVARADAHHRRHDIDPGPPPIEPRPGRLARTGSRLLQAAI